MFTRIIGRKCDNPECELRGQLQDAGLQICPSCATELKPEVQVDRRAVAIVSIAGLLVAGAASVFGYGFAIEDLTAVQTLKWVTGRLKKVESVRAPHQELLTGNISWWAKSGAAKPPKASAMLYEKVNGEDQFRSAVTADNGDALHFDLKTTTQNCYVVYRGPEAPRIFSCTPFQSTDRLQMSGPPGTEHFILVASRNPVPQLAQMLGTNDDAKGVPVNPNDIDRLLGGSHDSGDMAVYHVFVPHS